MKSKVLIIILIVFLFSEILFSQEASNIIIYKAIKNKPLSNDKKTVSTLGKLDNLIDKAEPIEFVLVFNDKVSVFKQMEKINVNDISSNLASILFGGNHIYYRNKETKEFFYQTQAYGDYFIININNVEWELSKETKLIENHVCFKATSYYSVDNSKGVFKHKVTAWYTPKIPINLGPKGYHGLPGLILELQERNLNYLVTKINLNVKDKFFIEKPIKGTVLSQKQFDDLGKEIGYKRQ
jgi:GLPGLI family protein